MAIDTTDFFYCDFCYFTGCSVNGSRDYTSFCSSSTRVSKTGQVIAESFATLGPAFAELGAAFGELGTTIASLLVKLYKV